MSIEGNTISKEILGMVDIFDCLDGEKKLEFFGILLEKLENGEIEVRGNPIYPEEIGVDDAYTCYATILEMICKT